MEEAELATGPHSSFCGSSQCSFIGNVVRGVDEVEEWEDRGGTLMCKQEDEGECACDIIGDMVMKSILSDKTTFEPMHTKSVSQKKMRVQKCNTTNSVNN